MKDNFGDYPISNMLMFKRLCYMIDTFNGYVQQTNDMGKVLYFLNSVKLGYKTTFPITQVYKFKYDINRIDVDIAELQKNMQNIHITRSKFVQENGPNITSAVSTLRYFMPQKDNTTGKYKIFYRKYRGHEDLMPYELVEFAAATYSFEQMLRN